MARSAEGLLMLLCFGVAAAAPLSGALSGELSDQAWCAVDALSKHDVALTYELRSPGVLEFHGVAATPEAVGGLLVTAEACAVEARLVSLRRQGREGFAFTAQLQDKRAPANHEAGS